jgi:hypothetical protein
MRLEEYSALNALWSCAERRRKEVLTNPNAKPIAIDTAQTRIGLVLRLTPVMDDLQAKHVHFRVARNASIEVAVKKSVL